MHDQIFDAFAAAWRAEFICTEQPKQKKSRILNLHSQTKIRSLHPRNSVPTACRSSPTVFSGLSSNTVKSIRIIYTHNPEVCSRVMLKIYFHCSVISLNVTVTWKIEKKNSLIKHLIIISKMYFI